MKISVILAHPDKGSFNHAIAGEVVRVLKSNGHKIFFHDLYKEKFDPLLPHKEIPSAAKTAKDIKRHCEEIVQSNGIVIIHPNWWGQPPAILKGWIDRVIRPGVGYEFSEGDNGEGVPTGLFAGKRVVIFNTSNTPKDREMRVFGDPLENLWRNCVFGLCGVKIFYRKMFQTIVQSSAKERKAWLKEAGETINKYYPATPR